MSFWLIDIYVSQLIMPSHDNYSFVTVRLLRRVEIGDHFLLLNVVLLLITRLRTSLDSIEWPEYDELLSSGLLTYFRRSGNTGQGFSTLFRQVCTKPPI